VKFKTPLTIIGTGAVGSSIAFALFYKRIRISALYSLSGASAKRIARRIGVKNFGTVKDMELQKGLVIVAVPDARIAETAQVVSANQKSYENFVFIHTSGSLSSEELKSLHDKGASVASFHPLQTFPASKITSLKNKWIAIEGDRKALHACVQLAKILDAHTFTISKETKVLYHTAAVFASNYLVTLLSVVEEIASRIHIPKKNIWKIYRPIIEQTVQNVFSSSPAKALTGPIARGDLNTVTKHLQELSKKKLNHLVPLYSVLGIETAKLAKKNPAGRH